MIDGLTHLGQFVAVALAACLLVGIVTFTGTLLGIAHHHYTNR